MRRDACPRAGVLVPLVLASALAPAVTNANGRFPQASHVLVGPGPSADTIALRTTFGFLVSDDSGRHFHWLCEDALDYSSAFDPAYALAADRSLHVGLADGLASLSPDRCALARRPALAGQFIVDLDNDPTGRHVVLVTSNGSPTAVNHVWRSDDAGGSFAPLGDGLPGELFTTLEMAPSDPQRVYLTSSANNPRTVRFFRSDDGGRTLGGTRASLQLPNATSAYIAGVDPSDRDTLYVRLVSDATSDAGDRTDATSLLRSDDAGEHWTEIAVATGPMLGFAIADDGRTLWYGGPLDGLHRSDDRGATWVQLHDTRVQCLRQHAGVLYVCGNASVDNFTLARSSNLGVTLEPLFSFPDVCGSSTCAQPQANVARCGSLWSQRSVAMFNVPPPADVCADVDARDAGTIDAMDAAVDVGAAADAHVLVATDAAEAANEHAGAPPSCACRSAPSAPSGDHHARAIAFTLVAGAFTALRRGRSRR